MGRDLPLGHLSPEPVSVPTHGLVSLVLAVLGTENLARLPSPVDPEIQHITCFSIFVGLFFDVKTAKSVGF